MEELCEERKERAER
jgi:colicin import membrane protein